MKAFLHFIFNDEIMHRILGPCIIGANHQEPTENAPGSADPTMEIQIRITGAKTMQENIKYWCHTCQQAHTNTKTMTYYITILYNCVTKNMSFYRKF
jgi:hypothetical protein